MHLVHVEKGHESAFHHDTDAAIHHGTHLGVTMVHSRMHRTYGFHDHGDARAFADKVRGKGFRTVHETNEDVDWYETFEDLDEACNWALEAATVSGVTYAVFCGNGIAVAMPREMVDPADVVEVLEPGIAPTQEAVIQRRAHATRMAANRKRSLTTMDHKRRKIAQTAKLWRLKNKSRIKGYQSVYNRPTKSMREAVMEGLAELEPVIARLDKFVGMLTEARTRAELDTEFIRLRRKRGWVSEGWDRTRILTEVDPSFVHHAEHYDRLLHGGDTFPGGGGLRWGGMVINEHEAVLRVMGSFEYKPDQTIYQQTIRFANYGRVAEDRALSWPDKARLLLTRDNLKVHCDCDAYRFWHQHAATAKGFAMIPEERAAPVNNPANRGGICKHLDLALKYIGGQAMRMASEMKSYHEGGKP